MFLPGRKDALGPDTLQPDEQASPGDVPAGSERCLGPGLQQPDKRHCFEDNEIHRVCKSSLQDMLMNCIKDKEKNHGNHPVIRIP
jgi:hypothetical protein